MHELALSQGIVAIVCQQAAAHGARRVRWVLIGGEDSRVMESEVE